MLELFFGGAAGLFTATALIGTIFFTSRLILMLVGGVDVDDADVDLSDADVDDSADAFKVLSIQTIAAFLMGFGWGGLGALRGAGWSLTVSSLFGVATGTGMVWLLAKLLLQLRRLEVRGNIGVADALLAEGTVYTRIPGSNQGAGRVRIRIDDRERFFKAMSAEEALETGRRVRVMDINPDNSVTVTPLDTAVTNPEE